MVIGLVVVLVAAGGATLIHVLDSGGLKAPSVTAVTPAVLTAVSAVSPAEENEVGLPSAVAVPQVVHGQPALDLNGHPGAFYIGGEFCPNCGAERWAVVMAFSRFGSFSGLKLTTSSPWDTDPSTPTFSFYGASYTSRYVTLLTDEAVGNDTSGLDTRKALQPPTALESSLWSKYEQMFGQGEAFPFVDIDNKVFVATASFDPGVLHGLDTSQVASDLYQATAPSTVDIVATASYLTAAICSLTGQQPASACSVGVVHQAESSMGLG